MHRIDSLDHIAAGLEALIVVDPRLERICALAHAVPLRRSEPGFTSLASIIVGQQLSTASAGAIWGRLIERIDPMTPENFIAAGESVWQAAGLSRSKQITLSNLSERIGAGVIDLHRVCNLPADDAIAQLTQLKGIGPWTAEVYLLFAAGHADVFPAGDVALQIAVGQAFSYETRPDTNALRAIAQQWSPWRGVAARLFWAYYAAIKGRDAVPVQ